jgi:hypothetical protein
MKLNLNAINCSTSRSYFFSQIICYYSHTHTQKSNMHSHSREIRVTPDTYTSCGVTQKVHANWLYLPPVKESPRWYLQATEVERLGNKKTEVSVIVGESREVQSRPGASHWRRRDAPAERIVMSRRSIFSLYYCSHKHATICNTAVKHVKQPPVPYLSLAETITLR